LASTCVIVAAADGRGLAIGPATHGDVDSQRDKKSVYLYDKQPTGSFGATRAGLVAAAVATRMPIAKSPHRRPLKDGKKRERRSERQREREREREKPKRMWS
jgi:hypothetical protein